MSQENHLVKITDFDTINSSLSWLLSDQSIDEVRLRAERITIFFVDRRDEDDPRYNLSSALVIHGDSTISGIKSAESLQGMPWFEWAEFGLLLGEWIESALIKPDGTLEIRFQSGAILTVAGEQHGELEESWDLFTSTDIYNTDIYSHAMPTDNLISVDSADGAVIAFLQPNQIISNKD
ncbi:hypothetical protein KBI23_00890 [bacterium]|jgi:hypothetical protein|nr:hypothetical protein [bacterium]MBP9089552.1 hypothetical protein [bacterium]MBP9808938.1 hypothetical protein [bacterium]